MPKNIIATNKNGVSDNEKGAFAIGEFRSVEGAALRYGREVRRWMVSVNPKPDNTLKARGGESRSESALSAQEPGLGRLNALTVNAVVVLPVE